MIKILDQGLAGLSLLKSGQRRMNVVTMKTHSGKILDLLSLTIDDINPYDIVFSLSRINRYIGHTERPYSVAQHCVIGARWIAPDFALEFLLHDAAEAYVTDVTSPVKQYIREQCLNFGHESPFKILEERVDAVIRRRFDLPPSMSPEVKMMDERMFVTEARDLFAAGSEEFAPELLPDLKPLPITLKPLPAGTVRRQYFALLQSLVPVVIQ